VIAGGGTGGHIYPGIAIAEGLLAADISNNVVFIGAEGGIENEVVPKERFSLKLIRSRGIARKFSFGFISSIASAVHGFFQARKILKDFRPDVVVSTGSYVGFPVVLAAATLRMPVLIHEQNTIPGLVNRISQRFARRVAVSFGQSVRHFNARKVIVSGNPVREKVAKAVRSVSRQNLGLDQKRKTLLILGGSQGARRINDVVTQLIDYFASEGIQVIHVTGRRDYDWVLSKTENRVLDIEGQIPAVRGRKKFTTITRYKLYRPVPYMYNIWDGLASADLVISRAGATALAEIACKGIPSVIVPFPYSSEGHQDANAKVFEDSGAAVVIKDGSLTAENLKNTMSSLFADAEKMRSMAEAAGKHSSTGSVARIVQEIYGIAGLSVPRPRKKVRRSRASARRDGRR